MEIDIYAYFWTRCNRYTDLRFKTECVVREANILRRAPTKEHLSRGTKGNAISSIFQRNRGNELYIDIGDEFVEGQRNWNWWGPLWMGTHAWARKTEHLPRARAAHTAWIRAWTEITRGKRDGKHGRIRHARPPRRDRLIFCPFPISISGC